MPEPADKLPDGATLTSSIPVAIPPKQEGLYREVLSILEDRHVPYAVAGAFALQQHTGICRYTKDLDIFLRSEDVAKALGHLREHGFECEICDPVWLAKAHRDEFFVDLITGMSNAVITVDSSWIELAHPALIVDIPTRVLAPEELLAVGHAVHPDVDDGRSRLDHVGLDEMRRADRRDEDVGLERFAREVARA